MWRKVLQICKDVKKTKWFFVLYLSICVNVFLFSNSIEMPEMPLMPSMPSVNFDGSFYKPTLPGIGSRSGVNKKDKSDSSDNSTVISSGEDVDSFLSNMLNDDSTLTANDISSLYDSGLFSDLGSLSSVLMPSNNYVTTTKTNTLLQNILNQLNELKKEKNTASPEQQQSFSDNKKDSENFDVRNPSILRFKINSYDIRDSLVEVFLSAPEPDGSFLLTADRNYLADGKTRSETFYLLFKNRKTAVSPDSYVVIPSLVQNYNNENSFIYRLCQINDLTAEKIGNLVVMKYSNNKFSVDLLIDLDQK